MSEAYDVPGNATLAGDEDYVEGSLAPGPCF